MWIRAYAAYVASNATILEFDTCVVVMFRSFLIVSVNYGLN